MKTEDIRITEVEIRLLDTEKDGLIGWASCVLNEAIYLNNIAIRKTQEGRIKLSFPARRSRNETKYFYFNPINRESMRILHEAIVDKLDFSDFIW